MSYENKRQALLFVILLLLAFAQTYWNTFDWLDQKISDHQFRFLRENFPKQLDSKKDVVIVGIDEETYKRIREPFALWHVPLGKFLSAMADAKPSVLGLDIVLPNRSYLFIGPQYDQSLLKGLSNIRSSTPLYLGQTMDEGGNFRSIFPPYVSVAGKDSFASVMVCLDSDGIIRRYDQKTCPTLVSNVTLAEKMASHLGAEGRANGLIDFRVGARFNHVSLAQVLEWYDNGEQAILSAVFQGRPVLLGVTMPFLDRIALPVALYGPEPDNLRVPGVLLHAQALRSLMAGGMVAPIAKWIMFLAVGLASLFWFGKTSNVKVAAFGAFVVAMPAASLGMMYSGWSLPVSAIIVTAIVAFLARLSMDSLLQILERNHMRKAFSGYVSPQMMEEILAGRLKVGLSGEKRTVCVMFADIRGYTTLSEKMPPEGVIALLNRYFEEVTRAIHEEGGTVNCIMGDGIMAIFGAPKTLDNPSSHAFKAARKMLARLLVLNRELELEGKPTLSIGIGLNVGEAIVGHVGSKARHDYSAIGDTTNVAARLEGLTKSLDHPLVCSRAVADALGFPERVVSLGVHPIKGRSPIEIYGWKEPAQAAEIENIETMQDTK